MKRYDVAIVGAGIVGLAHAWMAARCGLRVVVFERGTRASGATVRNFGMIWPIGQPAGECYRLALRSRQLWLELAGQSSLAVETCGALHVAHHDDEWQVLQEFCALGTHQVELLSAEEVCRRAAIVNSKDLRGGMFSATELRVDPRTTANQLASFLRERFGVEFHYLTPVSEAESGWVKTSDGRAWDTARTVICSGSDLRTLYPDVLATSQLQLCKLQMLAVANRRYPGSMPHIASGLTLRHYASFAPCPTLADVRHRIANTSPELDQFGIHVMASVTAQRILLGDSHVYGESIEPFDDTQIDKLILRELRRIIELDDWQVSQRWHGVYAKHPSLPMWTTTLNENLHIAVGTGGAGMTLALGLAERNWHNWTGG